MFRNSGPDPLTVRADIEYRRAIVDVLWMSGTILVAIGLAVMIAGALMPAIEITSSPSELASAYTKVPKVAGPSTVGKGPEGKDTKAAAKPTARRPKVPKRKPANAAVEWETGGAAPSPESRMPMFGAYSFGDRGKAEKEAVGPAQRADGAPPPAPAGEVPDFEEPAEDGPVQVSTLKPSWDHEGNGGATDSAGSGGWDDFGDGSLGESRQDERPPEETKEERPSDWLRKMIESK